MNEKSNKEQMTVALYARVSRHDKEQTPENQLLKLRRFAAHREWQIFEEFIDIASGGKASRPGLDRMMKLARGHRFDAVLIVRIDRIGRSVRNLHNLLDELKRANVGLICSDQEIDTSSPAGKLLYTILGAVSELELELIRERTMDGLARARAEGKTLGRPRFDISDSDILRLRAEGLSLKQIAEKIGMSHQGVKKRLRKVRVTKRVEN
ncbi:MAG: recombinase family protein [Candidatus Thermoplasmatota archaeon]|nr:recombinase family protein [Candidatus Thermoplasmatota archaeon]